MSVLVTRKPLLMKALFFNGVNNYVLVPHSDAFISREATLEVLVATSQLLGRYQVITTKWDGDVSHEVYVSGIDSYGNFYVIHRNTAGSRIAVTDGKAMVMVWYHLMMIYKSDEYLRLYVNGIAYTGTYSGTMYYNTGPLYIGQRGDRQFFFLGYIAYVRLYSRALSVSEILHNFRNPNNPVRDRLVLWLDARNVSGNTWYDLSGYRNHGTIYGATLVSLPNPPSGW